MREGFKVGGANGHISVNGASWVTTIPPKSLSTGYWSLLLYVVCNKSLARVKTFLSMSSFPYNMVPFFTEWLAVRFVT